MLGILILIYLVVQLSVIKLMGWKKMKGNHLNAFCVIKFLFYIYVYQISTEIGKL